VKKIVFASLLSFALMLFTCTSSETKALKATGPRITAITTSDTVTKTISWPGGSNIKMFVSLPVDGVFILTYDFTKPQDGNLYTGIKNLKVEIGGDTFAAWKDSGLTKEQKVKVEGSLVCVTTGQSYNLGNNNEQYWWLYGIQVGSQYYPAKRTICRFTMKNVSGIPIKVVLLHSFISGSF
jgi:hypothetical protein